MSYMLAHLPLHLEKKFWIFDNISDEDNARKI
jgi:hypothetical protein